MTPADVIREAEEDASEWLEMAENPAQLVAGVLAGKIVALTDYIHILEQRLKNDSNSTTRVN